MPPQHEFVDSGQDTAELPIDRRRMLILYGSETGNSEDSADVVERLACRLRFQTVLCEMNDVDLGSLLQYSLVIFIISTTGQGDLPRNARQFWKSLLRRRLPPDCLQPLRFTTFGLGDSSYTKFNWAARKLHKRLEQLGACEFFPRGEADECHSDGIDGAFLPWSLSLRSYLEREHPLPEGLSPIPLDSPLPPRFFLELAPRPRMDPPTETGVADAAACAAANDVGAALAPQTLDRTAALFSHVDNPHSELLRLEMLSERVSVRSQTYLSRLSEVTAKAVKGGIDILDRPNVLRDDPAQYSLEDKTGELAPPPEALLPIPRCWTAIVAGNERITPPEHWQDVRRLTLLVLPSEDLAVEDDGSVDVDESILTCLPGEAITLYPKNFPGDVQALIDLMGWVEVADQPFVHRARDNREPFSAPRNCHPIPNSTLRQLLTNNYDITSIPKRTFFENIALWTEDSNHRERLQEFSNPALSDEFYDYTSRPRRSILEVLQDFPSVQIPYYLVPSIFPVIRGRDYSIANGGKLLLEPTRPGCTRIELLIALVKYKTVLRKTRQGLCSRYVASLPLQTAIQITTRMGEAAPSVYDNQRPFIGIGPGTGVAPLRSFFWSRAMNRVNAENVLFFGGRKRNADFYFEKEWEHLGVEIYTAFSRDQKEKIYVQDRIREQAGRVCELLRKNAVVALCGSSGKMPEAVKLALYDAMVIGKMAPDRETAEKLFRKYTLWEEVW
ncbi:riboflavin synthase domain-like protein [Xylariaceae sp. FL0804]|nr:riboflavin synthase domain-like protein [Xylariaceae sp. FL0804]